MSKILDMFGGRGGDDLAAEERARQAQREQRIATGMSSIRDVFGRTFNPEFYTGIETAYTDFAQPQLEEQFSDQMKALTTALSGADLLDSRVRATKIGDLERQRQRGMADITARANEIARGRRGEVARLEAELVNQLHATADPTLALQGANAAVASLGGMPRFEMLENMIDDVAGTVGDQYSARLRMNPRTRLPVTSSGGAGSVFVT